MPRISRGLADGHCYHILNRGNGRQQVFHKDDDYRAFINLLGETTKRYSIELFAYCLMPNHFHLLLRTVQAGDLSRGMQWFTTVTFADTIAITVAADTSGKGDTRVSS